MATVRGGQIAAGVALIVAGLTLFGMQMGFWAGWPLSRSWPVILILVGLAQLLGSNDRTRFGAVIMSAGVIVLLHTTEVLSLRLSWPLFIVVNGLYILLTAGRWSGGRRGTPHAD